MGYRATHLHLIELQWFLLFLYASFLESLIDMLISGPVLLNQCKSQQPLQADCSSTCAYKSKHNDKYLSNKPSKVGCGLSCVCKHGFKRGHHRLEHQEHWKVAYRWCLSHFVLHLWFAHAAERLGLFSLCKRHEFFQKMGPFGLLTFPYMTWLKKRKSTPWRINENEQTWRSEFRYNSTCVGLRSSLRVHLYLSVLQVL